MLPNLTESCLSVWATSAALLPLKSFSKYGYEDPGLKSRPVRKEDLEQFDLIVGMDRENLRDLKRLDKKGQWTGKIVPMCFFTTRFPDEEVPDPYYGGQEGFEHFMNSC